MTEMQALPRVAICLAAFNGTRWLDEQLDSILRQEGVLPTVYVSVDCSTDGTEAWIDRRAADDSRIVVLPHGKRFGTAAKNFFRLLREVDFAEFDYVSLADQDDIWLENKLFHAITRMESLSLDAFSSDVMAFWEDGHRQLVKKSYAQKKYDYFSRY